MISFSAFVFYASVVMAELAAVIIILNGIVKELQQIRQALLKPTVTAKAP